VIVRRSMECENHTHIHSKALKETDYCQRVFSAILSTADVSSISGKESSEIFIINWNRNIELLIVPIYL